MVEYVVKFVEWDTYKLRIRKGEKKKEEQRENGAERNTRCDLIYIK